MLSVAVVAAVAIALFSIYQASRQVPEFYLESLALDDEHLIKARDEFVAQTTALASDLHRSGAWTSLFTAEQINAYLALELARSFPDLMPSDLEEPRIFIREHEATIACRYKGAEVDTVLSLTVEAYLQDTNVLALRIRRARAGALPVPLAQVLDAISRAAGQLDLRIQWRKSHGDPVALLTFPSARKSSDSFRLQAVELRDGAVFAAGSIGPEQLAARPSEAKSSEPAAKIGEPVPADESAADDQPLIGAAEKETRQK